MHKVLVLDGNQRSALATTRSLGQRGIQVVVADEFRETLSGSSRYCSERFTYPSPYCHSDEFLAVLREEASRRGISIFLPMTDVTTNLILQHRGEFRGIGIPFSSFEQLDELSDKCKLFELARQLGIPMPITRFVRRMADLHDLQLDLEFPVVLKPFRSTICTDGGWIRASVSYARSFEEISEVVGKSESFKQHPFLIQEYIPGTGHGIFALYDYGKPAIFFAHKRIREKPPSGGVSVLSESVELDPAQLGIAKKLLDHVKLHGVAMVELKVSADGKPYLIEVNARFWGSLQLAIDAGVDFPYMLYRMAIGDVVTETRDYNIGARSRWLLGDLDHLYLRLKSTSSGPSEVRPRLSRWRAFVEFLRFLDKNTKYDVNRWHDIKPFLFELRTYFSGNRR